MHDRKSVLLELRVVVTRDMSYLGTSENRDIPRESGHLGTLLITYQDVANEIFLVGEFQNIEVEYKDIFENLIPDLLSVVESKTYEIFQGGEFQKRFFNLVS